MTRILPLFLAATLAQASPPAIDDQALIRSFQNGVGAFAGQDGVPSADELATRANQEGTCTAGEIALPPVNAGPADYDSLSQSVFMIGSVYKCGKCEHWHAGGIATAWCLSDDGLMVTNAHVFQKTKGAAMGICDRAGKCHPVTELVAIHRSDDIAVFRVKGEGFRPLPLGEAAGVGSAVRVISHPSHHLFMHTSGEVARYAVVPARGGKETTTWMAITADYAKGSSGGPVFNETGAIVGMVSSTESIYYDSNDSTPKGPLQMVIKNCVPVAAIRDLLGRK